MILARYPVKDTWAFEQAHEALTAVLPIRHRTIDLSHLTDENSVLTPSDLRSRARRMPHSQYVIDFFLAPAVNFPG
jgi:hypothetical protein